MLPPLALRPNIGDAVLDMCASPGGKSSFLAQLAGEIGFILANEPSQTRLATLRANLHTLNLPNVATCGYDGARLPLRPNAWNAILLDPPCSGWGTEEKHPKVCTLWKGKKIDTLAGLQRLLLRRASELLAPGGRLLYSTCTTNPAENQDQVRFAGDELGLVPEALEGFPGFVFEETDVPGTLLVDGKGSGAQGFFLALLRKPARTGEIPAAMSSDAATPVFGDGPSPRRRSRRGGEGAGRDGKSSGTACGVELPPTALAVPGWSVQRLPPGRILAFGEKVRFLPRLAETMVPKDMVWQGALLGKFSGGRFRPAPRLRTLMADETCAPRLVLEETGAVRSLLAGESLSVGFEEPWVGLWWRDLPLGSVCVKRGRVLASFA